MTEENTTELYYYPLSSPLTEHRLYHYPLSSPIPFQAGDILGFFQPDSQFKLLYEWKGRGRQRRYLGITTSSYSQVSLSGSGNSQFQVLINAITGESHA